VARLRTIKPSFFLNEELSRVPPLGRLLFAGLWCIADRRGRLEDRPNRIKVEVLPYDKCSIDSLLKTLADNGFIERYEVDPEHRYIQIVNFEKHQNPHLKEAESTIPAPGLHGASTVQAPTQTGTSTNLGDDEPRCVLGSGIHVLEPDYGNLEPDHGNLGVGSGDQAAPAASPPAQLTAFDEVMRGVAGYVPDERLYATILSRYPSADYESEAMKLADHLRRGGREASTSRILNWFKGIRETGVTPANGRQRASPISHAGANEDPDRFTRDPVAQKGMANFMRDFGPGANDATAKQE
jgi:hypothetical protein